MSWFCWALRYRFWWLVWVIGTTAISVATLVLAGIWVLA